MELSPIPALGHALQLAFPATQKLFSKSNTAFKPCHTCRVLNHGPRFAVRSRTKAESKSWMHCPILIQGTGAQPCMGEILRGKSTRGRELSTLLKPQFPFKSSSFLLFPFFFMLTQKAQTVIGCRDQFNQNNSLTYWTHNSYLWDHKCTRKTFSAVPSAVNAINPEVFLTFSYKFGVF